MPIFKTRDDLKIELNENGYSDLKEGSTSKTVVVLLPRGGDRVGTLINIASKLKLWGGKYNDKGGGSSIGRTEFTSSYRVECKIKGGGGSGAGSDLTDIAESAQCIFLAAKYNKKGVYDKASLLGASSHYDVTNGVTDAMTKLDESWIQSSVRGADFLKNKFPNTGKSYIAHRGSTWVKKLETHWKALNTEAGKPFGNLNKWSPADVWLVSAMGKRVDLTKTNTLVELNNLLLKNYKSKDIVGVSLKKLQMANPRFGELNMSSARKTFAFESTTTGLVSFFNSGDGYVLFGGSKMQVRKFGSTWQGELKGQFANMGKISGGPIIKIVKEVFGVDMIPQIMLKNRTKADEDKFYDWYKSVPYHDNMSKADFIKATKEKDQNWFLSKIMTTQLISIIENGTTKQKDQFTSSVVNYAASESRLSGPYCKIY